MANISNLGKYERKPLKEYLTPYKISVLVLIDYYLSVRRIKRRMTPTETLDSDIEFFSETEERNFIFTTLKLMHMPDMSLSELNDRISSIGSKNMCNMFNSRLAQVQENELEGLTLFFNSMEATISVSPSPVSQSSTIGLFIRRMNVAFNRLSFSQLCKLYTRFQDYMKISPAEQSKEDTDDMNTSMDLTEGGKEMDVEQPTREGVRFLDEPDEVQSDEKNLLLPSAYSRRQAHHFIDQQAALLQHNDSAALPPNELQKIIRQILKTNPGLAEAHFLSYLNNMRVGEFNAAQHHLYHFFDRHLVFLSQSSKEAKDQDDENNKRFRYAALNLARLHYQFGHREEALAAIKEAVRMAQEANDNICLQYALGWMQRLGRNKGNDSSILTERNLTRSAELNLPYIMALSIHSYTQINVSTKPSRLFDFLMKGELLHFQHAMLDIMTMGFAQKAALWSKAGNGELCSLNCQQLLNLESTENGVYHMDEPECIALCNLVHEHASKGLYDAAFEILNFAKQSFPHPSQHARLWQLTEQIVLFEKAMNSGNVSHTTEEYVANMGALDEHEAKIRQIEILKHRGSYEGAVNLLLQLDKEKLMKNKVNHNIFASLFKIFLISGEVDFLMGHSSLAIVHILNALVLATERELTYSIALATMYLAALQFHISMPCHALELISNELHLIYTHGSLFDTARTLLLYARCLVSVAALNKDNQTSAHLSAVELCLTACTMFKTLEANRRLKDVYYFQARLYNDLGYMQERNDSALQFKLLEEQYPSQTGATINYLL